MPTSTCPQKPRQAQHRQALDQGANPGQWVLRNPKDEVGGAGEEKWAQAPAQVQLLWEQGATEPLELSQPPAPGMSPQENPPDLGVPASR